jgi:UMF1 family MFS transporter
LYMLCSYFAIQGNGFGTLVTFTLGLYTYLLSFTSYSPLISDISSDTNRGFVSGLGIASNYVGQFVGLLIALPFSNGTMSLFGSNPRAETLLPSVIAFCVLALPMLIWFKEPKIQNQLSVGDNEVQDNSNSSIISSLIRDTSIIYKLPGVALFLLSYFLFNDAVLTASNNFPIFLESVWGVSDTVKTYILLGILVTSALGGLISGKIADKIGHKRTLMWITGGWIVILPLVGLSTQFSVFVSMTVIMGFWFGSNWAVSRSVMSYLAPARYTNLTFAYYGLVERASSFVGPIIWGLTIYHFEYAGVTKYRYATLAITCFILLGFIVLSKVRSDR